MDGNERVYGYLTAEDYFRGFHDIRQQALALVPPELWGKYRAQVGAQEWTVEMAPPWTVVGGRPAPTAGWHRGLLLLGANLCRQRGATGELTSWSPMFRGFLEPKHFGVWEFLE